MERTEGVAAVKSLVYLSASVGGLDVGRDSLQRFVELTERAFSEKRIESTRRPEIAANLLRLIAAALEFAQQRGHDRLHEEDADSAKEKVCPVYPFD